MRAVSFSDVILAGSVGMVLCSLVAESAVVGVFLLGGDVCAGDEVWSVVGRDDEVTEETSGGFRGGRATLVPDLGSQLPRTSFIQAASA